MNLSMRWLLTLLLLTATESWSVTEYKKSLIPFTKELKDLKPSIELPLVTKELKVDIPLRKLKIRAINFSKDERVDPVQVYVPHNEEKFHDLILQVARKSRRQHVEEFFKERIAGKKEKSRYLIDIPKDELRNFRLKGISKAMARVHYDVTVLTKKLNANRKLRREFLNQMKLFLSGTQRMRISKKLRSNKDLILHRDLLPRFARKMAKRYVVFRGPNCFHAALAFHDQMLTRSEEVNVKEEKGYHRAMINYDELWRAINRHFYEVDPQKSDLKYGDMLVFFNLPKGTSNQVNFRWIRHTATYLFGEYTFSKGSKSPNTPYTVKTLGNEWETWRHYTKRLGVKIFRRASRNIDKTPPKDLTDWIF